jgi:hypothetical protein
VCSGRGAAATNWVGRARGGAPSRGCGPEPSARGGVSAAVGTWGKTMNNVIYIVGLWWSFCRPVLLGSLMAAANEGRDREARWPQRRPTPHAIDSGQTGDKVPFPDIAASPLGDGRRGRRQRRHDRGGRAEPGAGSQGRPRDADAHASAKRASRRVRGPTLPRPGPQHAPWFIAAGAMLIVVLVWLAMAARPASLTAGPQAPPIGVTTIPVPPQSGQPSPFSSCPIPRSGGRRSRRSPGCPEGRLPGSRRPACHAPWG